MSALDAAAAAMNGSAPALSQEEMVEMGIKAALSDKLGSYLGPFMAGWYLDFIMFGIMAHQLTIWAANAKTERRFVQVVVILVSLAATAITCHSIWYLWTSFVEGFGNFTNVVKIDKVLNYTIMNPLVVIPVQIFYIERAYRINRNAIWIPIVCVVGIGLSLAGAIGSRPAAISAGSLQPIPISGNLFTDLFVTGTMAYGESTPHKPPSLLTPGLSKSKTGWSETDRLINRIIRTSLETQIPGSIISISHLLVYIFTASKQASTAATFFIFIGPKAHVIPLLAVLNYRFTLRQELGTDAGHSSGVRRTNVFAMSNRHQQETQIDGGVKVDTVTYQETHHIADLPMGLNRQRQPDADSTHSDITGKTVKIDLELGSEEEPYGYFDSSTMLNRPPSRSK